FGLSSRKDRSIDRPLPRGRLPGGEGMEKYEVVRDIGSGNSGVARLMRNKETKELVAMKYIPRGEKVRSLGPLPMSSSREVLLSAAHLRRQLLPLHGNLF
ncbi:hypothetical protein BHE74_00034868, partial [Ensete ventricosum]